MSPSSRFALGQLTFIAFLASVIVVRMWPPEWPYPLMFVATGIVGIIIGAVGARMLRE